jgi:hypothetical protein
MAYTDQATLAADSAFRSRVQMALVTAARTVVQQAAGASDFGPDYQRKRKLAAGVLRAPASLVDMAAWTLASIPTMTATTTDAQLQGAVDVLLVNLAKIDG